MAQGSARRGVKAWTVAELRGALALYCQLPFGRMHARNAEIVALAARLGRSPAAVAMKLVNFASLDPDIAASGRRGLGNASALDRQVWAEFQQDWEAGLAHAPTPADGPAPKDEWAPDVPTSAPAWIEARRKQALFRRVVLGSYAETCCISGLADPRLLVASHIVPWAVDPRLRLNPKNGLCLSALHDRAFDRGLLTVLPDLTVRVSAELRRAAGQAFLGPALLDFDGRRARLPEKFHPHPDWLRWHNEHVFLG